MKNSKLTNLIVKKYKLLIMDLDGTLVTLRCDWEKVKQLRNLGQEEEARKIELEGVNESIPVVSVIHLLRHFKGKKALFSMNYKDTITAVLKQFNLLSEFDIIVSRDSVFHKKPHPEGLRIIIDTFKIPKEEVIFIGDRNIDILAGNNYGISTLLVQELSNERLSI